MAIDKDVENELNKSSKTECPIVGTKISKTACVALGGGIASGITTFGTSLYLFGECMYRTTAQPEFMDYVGVGLSSGMMGLIGAGAGSAICFGAAYFINRNKN